MQVGRSKDSPVQFPIRNPNSSSGNMFPNQETLPFQHGCFLIRKPKYGFLIRKQCHMTQCFLIRKPKYGFLIRQQCHMTQYFLLRKPEYGFLIRKQCHMFYFFLIPLWFTFVYFSVKVFWIQLYSSLCTHTKMFIYLSPLLVLQLLSTPWQYKVYAVNVNFGGK